MERRREQGIRKQRKDAKELNHFLDLLQSKAYDARKQLIESGRVVTAIAIMDIMSGA